MMNVRNFTEEEVKEINEFKQFLRANKLTFDQFIRVNNYLLDLKKEKPTNINLFIDAYQAGEFTGIGLFGR